MTIMSSPPMRAGRRSTTGVFGAFTSAACRAAVAEMNRLPPGRILELGVGTGISLPLYERKHRIVGIDLSRDMLDRATKRVAEEGLSHVEGLEVMDASALTFADRSLRRGDGDVRDHRRARPGEGTRRDGAGGAAGRARRPGQPLLGRFAVRAPSSRSTCRAFRQSSAGGRISRSRRCSAGRSCGSSNGAR